MSGAALFGGTFNPPHLGHRRLLESAIEAAVPQHTIVMPANVPPHKQAHTLASAADRLEMCRLAFGDIPGAEISDWELNREGKSYSIYTVRHLREIYPDGRLWFIMGSDMLLSFEKWYCWQELLTLCTPLCLARCANDAQAALRHAERLTELTGIREAARVVQAEPIEVSSTQLRETIANGGAADGLIGGDVLGYIRSRKLYSKDK